MYQIKEISEACGVSKRTLRYYDTIGLLSPSKISESGYRLYTEKDLEKMQEILFFKELSFKLKEIKAIMEHDQYKPLETFQAQRDLLILKRDRLNRVIKQLNDVLDDVEKGDFKMTKENLGVFSKKDIISKQKAYKSEVKEKYGDTQYYEASQKRTKNYTKEDWHRVQDKSNRIFDELYTLIDEPVNNPEVQKLVSKWRQFITQNFYECDLSIFKSLGEMYIQDERFTKNIDEGRPGLSQFIKEAIDYYCEVQ